MLRKKTDDPDAIEERLRNRLADLEGRLEDQQKVKRLENHIQNLNEQHRLEKERIQLEAKKKIDEANDALQAFKQETKQRFKQEIDRRRAIQQRLTHFDKKLRTLQENNQALAEKGLHIDLIPPPPSTDPQQDPTTYLERLTLHLDHVQERLEHIQNALGEGELETRTTGTEILEDQTQALLSNPNLRSKALTVSENARLFADDDAKNQYHQELLTPYTNAIQRVLQEHQRAHIVHGCETALNILKDAFTNSRTYLLRRSEDLDGFHLEPDVITERFQEQGEDAQQRIETILDNARALGPVDFFENLNTTLARALERGDEGANEAAWILSDVTVHLLEHEHVRNWLENQH